MKKILALLFLLFASPAFAESLVVQTCGTPPQQYSVGSTRLDTVDINGNKCAGSSVINDATVQGDVADGATDSGNPVKVGGVQMTTLPTYTNGQRVTAQFDTHGGLYIVNKPPNGTAGYASINMTADGVAALANNPTAAAFNLLFNGASWDRMFTCPNSAVINVTAGATTQLVALSGATNIRVCSFAITMAAAGTAQFVSGTGTNCGTGTANITGAFTLATGTPLALSDGRGSVFRAGASNALCLAAVTGNVTGVLSYAQY